MTGPATRPSAADARPTGWKSRSRNATRTPHRSRTPRRDQADDWSPDEEYGPIYRNRTPVTFDGYLTDVLAHEAGAFIERNRANPFFLFLSFNAVHTPMHAKPALLDRFAAVPDPNRRTYLATLASLDEAVGTVFAKLRNTGLEEDTLVFFLGDNLLPHLGGQNIHAPHEGLYWRFGSQMAVRQGPWKLVRASRGATEYSDVPVQPMLINLEQDVGERHDLAGENPALVRELQAAWDGWNTGNIAPRWPATVRGKPFLNP